MSNGVVRPTALTPGRLPWRLLGLVVLGGLLILAHGCHGDEDHELLGWLRAWLK